MVRSCSDCSNEIALTGWRLRDNEEKIPFLRQEWTAKDNDSAKRIAERIEVVAEEAGHHPELHIGDNNSVTADLCSKSLGEPSLRSHISAFFTTITLASNMIFFAVSSSSIASPIVLPEADG